MFIQVNTQVVVEDLIKGMIVQSGNDACVALAEAIAGSEENFAQMMNREAQRLGMKNSSFRNAAGRVCEGEIDRTALGRHLILRCFPCPEGGLCVHCQDITDRRAHEQALQTSAEQYRSVVEDQNEIICRHRPGDGCYTFVNKGFCRFFGRSRENE